MENEKKYTPTCYTIARVVGDAEVKTGTNGKEYRVVPVELLGGRKASAFCNAAPEIDSYVTVRVQHRENGFAYTVFGASMDVIKFAMAACSNWSYVLLEAAEAFDE